LNRLAPARDYASVRIHPIVEQPMPDTTDSNGNGAGPVAAAFRLFRPNSPTTALGMAVNYLMTKPAFAQLRFGDWSRILVGQINRKHYCFVIDERQQIQGFLGWAVTTKDKAEAWVEGRGAVDHRDANNGGCIIFNAWASSAPRVNRVLLDAARQVIQGKDMVYFKRHYKDGSTRPVRLSVNEFVDQHIVRNRKTSAA
jgi:hemolysin-activating ACP:hemolysin acyltransferase